MSHSDRGGQMAARGRFVATRELSIALSGDQGQELITVTMLV
ncbi:hypothetical protein ACIBQ1_26105 [Nonomuraea sp. NPDC050153]